ncbi:CoA transferase [Rhodobacteraceae bacterium HSP-20]|uniref:CoA transferase n=1 Tax=Paragemmobacter amnigenus TaxID=2852097 RepID=A0ABS6J4K7_9RHOB|nr:CoA transferase [Rhodobacter amnigenus]MBU9698417.1 CoA transferase [Rhodobacter amnigenus]MBV4389644.1 CoA transferase [Rhodobacter amnigenus]
MAGVLAGMRVVEGSAFVAVPLAGMTLAQMGADVIRFDRPQGGLDAHRWPVTKDGTSLFWAGLNKGKRSLAVDMARPEGQEIISELICAPGPDAGMFLTNLRVRGWMDYPALKARREDLIMVSLLGTRRGEPAVDYTVNPSLGFPMATGAEGSAEPVAHVLPAWDCIAGGMVVQALLAAERHRLRTGKGQVAELALKDVAAAMLANLGIVGEVVANGVDRPKAGNSLYGAYGQDFTLACGRRVMVIGLTDRQWRGLVKVLGLAQEVANLGQRMALDLSKEGDRWEARKEITALFAPWFAARRLEVVAPLFDGAGLTWSVFRSFAQAVAEDPDLSEENPMMRVIHQPGVGALPVPGSPVTFSDLERMGPVPAPVLGEHTEAILADVLGLGSGQIGRLMDEGVVSQGVAPKRAA